MNATKKLKKTATSSETARFNCKLPRGVLALTGLRVVEAKKPQGVPRVSLLCNGRNVLDADATILGDLITLWDIPLVATDTVEVRGFYIASVQLSFDVTP